MQSRLTQAEMTALIRRLAVGYGRAMSATELAEALPVWRDTLAGVPWADLERAVDTLIREPGRFMPRPGEVRRLALGGADRQQRRQHGVTDETWARDPWEPGYGDEGRPFLCPHCGGDVRFERTPDHRVIGHIRHYPSCGRAARVERETADLSMPADPASPAEVAARREEYRRAASEAAA